MADQEQTPGAAELDRLHARRAELEREIKAAPGWGAAVGAMNEELRGVNRTLAALAAQPQNEGGAGAGWKLVPAVATQEMLDACWLGSRDYAALLAAAPTPPAGEAVEDEDDPDEPIPGFDCSPFGMSPVLMNYRLRKEGRAFTQEDRNEAADLIDRLTAEIETLEAIRPAGEAVGGKKLADGCCSAFSPCTHQKKDPTTICGACQRAAADRDFDEDLMPGGFN